MSFNDNIEITYSQGFYVGLAIKARFREIKRNYLTIDKFKYEEISHLAEVYALCLGFIPHSNLKLISARKLKIKPNSLQRRLPL